MKILMIAAVGALALGTAAWAQTPAPPTSAAQTPRSPERAAPSTQMPKAAAAPAARPKGSTVTPDATSEGAKASATEPGVPYDRRVEALKGASSTASPNIDPAAALNQVTIPDYPPADADRTTPRPKTAPPPR